MFEIYAIGASGQVQTESWSDRQQMFGKMGVKIYNPDGSEAAISGNGLCIFAKYLEDAGYVIKKELVLQTKSREVTVHYHSY